MPSGTSSEPTLQERYERVRKWYEGMLEELGVAGRLLPYVHRKDGYVARQRVESILARHEQIMLEAGQ